MTPVPVGPREREPERPELSPVSFAIASDLQLHLATSSHEAPFADSGRTAALVPAHSR